MIARTTRRPHRRRPRATFTRAYAPLRRQWQGRYTRDTREPLLRQYERLTAEDRPPIAVERGRYYAPAPVPDLPLRWRRQLAHALILAVVALLLYGVR